MYGKWKTEVRDWMLGVRNEESELTQSTQRPEAQRTWRELDAKRFGGRAVENSRLMLALI